MPFPCTLTGLLNLLHAKAASLAGDRAKRALVHRLLHAAATPYFKWVQAPIHAAFTCICVWA